MNASVASQKITRNLYMKVLKGLRNQNGGKLVDLCE